jgi:flagellar biosynthesis protein FlhB
VQVRGVVAAERIRPDLERISPRAGLRRLFSTRTFVRAVLAAAKIGVVAAVGYWTFRPALRRLAGAGALDASGLAGRAGSLVGALAIRIALCLLALAVADFLYQRWQYRRDLRMTRREWLEDIRKAEGDWRLRRRRREVARHLSDAAAGRGGGAAADTRFPGSE